MKSEKDRNQTALFRGAEGNTVVEIMNVEYFVAFDGEKNCTGDVVEWDNGIKRGMVSRIERERQTEDGEVDGSVPYRRWIG